MSIALSNGMSPVLAIISRDLLGVHSKVKDIEKGFGRWALAAGGAAGVIGGVAMFGALAKLAQKGSEVNHQLELMKIQGAGAAEIQQASAAAMAVSGKVLTTTYAENLKHLRELKYAFGDMPDAMRYLETVSKSNAILNAMNGGKGAGGRDQVWELVKSLEQKGLTAKPEEFQSYVDQMTKAVVASGGKVTPAAFFAAFKYGRTAMLGWDETFISQYLPRLIQSMSTGNGGGGGSGGPGNALMSAFAKVVQGQMPKKAAEMFAEYGLAQVSHIKGSSQSTVGAVKDAETFMHNPYEWVQSTLIPALAAKGVNTPEKIIDVISKMFPVRTASQIVTEMALQGRAILGDHSPFEKDAKLQRAAFDQRMSYDELIKGDYDTVMKSFHAQWEHLQQVVGAPLTEPGGPLVSAMAHITSLMNSMAQFAGAHPEGVKIAIDAIAALATSLVVVGLAALAAAIAPLVGAGAVLVAIAAGLAALAALNWDKILKFVDLIKRLLQFAGIIAATPQEKAALKQGAIEDSDSLHSSLRKKFGDPKDYGLGWLQRWITPPDGTGNSTESGAPASSPYIPPPRPQSYNPPPSNNGGTVHVAMANVNLDGRKVGEAQVRFLLGQGSGPAQGAPYHDSTRSTQPLDFALTG